MLSPAFKKLLLVMVLAATGAALLLQFMNSKLKPLENAPPKISKSDFTYHYTPPAMPIGASKPDAEPETDDALGLLKLPRDKVEAWLAKHNRNAASLVAAFHAINDTNYLNEAATNFPNDPHVELAVLARDEFPAGRRKWLALFKASSPSNSLADYFSAQDYFKNGKSDEAVQELLAASGKSEFDNHTMEAQLDAEELYLDSGKTPEEAANYAMSAMAGEDLPELATIKRLDHDIADLMQQKITAGDANSAANLAQMGMIIADKLNSGDSGKYLINSLVGIATVSIVLQRLDQNAAYDFLGGQTPSQVSQALKQQVTAFNELSGKFKAAYPSMTDAEWNNYRRRSQIYGETAAMQWGVQQHPPVNPGK